MNGCLRHLTRILLPALLLSTPVLASAAKPKESKEEKLKKPRLAILDFPPAAGGWSCAGWNQSEHRMSNVLRDLFTTEIAEKAKGKVRIVERERLSDLQKELSFEQSGEVDGATAQRIGKLLGVRYMLSGKITRFACKKTEASTGWGVGSLVGKLTGSGTAGAVAGSVQTAKMKFSGRIDVRLIDTQSGEILATAKDEEETADSSVKIAGGGSTVDYDEELVNKVYEPIVQRMAPKLVKKITAAHAENLADDEDDDAPPPPRKVAAAKVDEAPPAKKAPEPEAAPAPAPSPAPVAYGKAPGLYWEQTMSGQMGGFTMPAKTSKVCMPKNQWEQPPKMSGDDCTFTDLKRSGSKMSWKMTCKNGMTGEGEMTWTPDTYSGWTSMVTPAGEMKMNMSGKRLGGDCEAVVPKRE